MRLFGMDIADKVISDAVVQIAATLVASEDVLGHMTCTEVDELARSLALLGMQDEGESLIFAHATLGDGQGDDGHGSIVADDDETLTRGAQTEVRAHVEALAAGRVEPGDRMDR